MGQLYLDGDLDETEWKTFITQNIHNGSGYSYLYNEFAAVICQCHFIEMLPEIQFLIENDLIDEMCVGNYDSYVDEMFCYSESEQNFCETPLNATDMLRNWSMFENDDDKMNTVDEKTFEKMLKAATKSPVKATARKKIGRNDPCPCGSGKKYKFCCMNKPKSPLDSIESPEERNKWLQTYPDTGSERKEGRIYLEDYFDPESIEIDKLLYLALMDRPGLIWLKNESEDNKRIKEQKLI